MCFCVTKKPGREMIKEKYSLKWLKVRELWKSEIKTDLQHSCFQSLQTALFAYGCLFGLQVPLFLKESHLQPPDSAFVIQAPGTGALGSQEPRESHLTSSQLRLRTSKDKKHKKRREFQKASSNENIVNGTTNKKANLVQKMSVLLSSYQYCSESQFVTV